MPRIPRPLLAAGAVYLVLRAVVLFADFDSVAAPIYELTLVGNLAKMASEGWGGVPLVEYYDDCGGQVITGLLAAPLYALLGDSSLVLKLVPVSLGLVSLALIWRIVARQCDRRAAAMAVFLFALVPPTLFKLSMVTLGHHFEGLAFQLAAYAAFLEAHRRGTRRCSFAWAFAAGFALFFTLSAVFLVAILCAVHLLIRGPRRTLGDLGSLAGGFALGLLPLLWVNSASNGRVVDFLLWKTGVQRPFSFTAAWRHAGEFLFDVLPRASVFESLGPLSGRIADGLFLAVFLVAWGLLAVRLARGIVRALASHRGAPGAAHASDVERLRDLWIAPLVLYLPCLLVFFAVTRLHLAAFLEPLEVLQFRYLLPHFLFAAMAIAVASSELMRSRGRARSLGIVLPCAAFATSLWMLPILVPADTATGSRVRYAGFGFDYYPQLVLRDALLVPPVDGRRVDRRQVARELADLPNGISNEAWFGVGHRLGLLEVWPRAHLTDPPGYERALADLFDDHPERYAIDLARGVGSWMRRCATEDPRACEALATLFGERLEGQCPTLAAYLVEGSCLDFGQQLARVTTRALETNARMEGVVPPQWRSALRRGQGIAVGRLLLRGIESDVAAALAWSAGVPCEERADLWFGVGWGLIDGGEEFALEPEALHFAIRRDRPFLVLGAGAALRHIWGETGAAARAAALRERLDPPEQCHLDRGLQWPRYPEPLEL